MHVYAIADLHLSFAKDKPMDVFGDLWKDHACLIREYWQQTVSEGDIVLIPGDISWAMQLKEAKSDLDFIASLNGRKILLRGNHDYWWNSVTQLRSCIDPSIFCIQNDCITLEGYSFSGTRMWTIPEENSAPEDIKIYQRELGRLKMSLDRMPAGTHRIVMMHYPPMNERHEDNEVTKMMQNYSVETVVYGHLHGKAHYAAFNGERNGISYKLCSSDFLEFKPLLIV